MRNGKNSCLFGEELISYIYGELPDRERDSFESHLLNCSSCTNEFAELSVSRLGVYEWHRDQFLPLETPRFAIPYAKPEATYSWLDAIRGFIFTPARLSLAGGALALVVIALGLFYVADSNSTEIANDVQVAQPVIPNPKLENPTDVVRVIDEKASDNVITDIGLLDGDQGTQMADSKAERRPVPVQISSTKKPASKQLTARRNRPVNVLRLGTFEEVEDTSLRLADLVADIDSRRK